MVKVVAVLQVGFYDSSPRHLLYTIEVNGPDEATSEAAAEASRVNQDGYIEPWDSDENVLYPDTVEVLAVALWPLVQNPPNCSEGYKIGYLPDYPQESDDDAPAGLDAPRANDEQPCHYCETGADYCPLHGHI